MAERVIVIGAGVGGLVAAALLAARGCAVTVIEAAAGPGGKLRQLDAGGVAIDAGPTVFTLRETFEEIFAACGASLSDHLTARPARVLARHAWGDTRLDLFADPAASEAAIGEFAGAAEARGYRAFRAEAKRLYEALDRPFMRAGRADPLTLGWRMGRAGLPDYLTLRPYTSLWHALGGYFRDPRLRQLFGRYATYSGSSPFRAPATLMLIAHVEALGVWLVDGGMFALAKALEALGRKQGVQFHYSTAVARIVVERGRAAGVELASGERLTADAVICNTDPAALADGSLGVRATAPLRPRERSLSALVWLVNAETAGFPLAHHNVLFSSDYAAEFSALQKGTLAAEPTIYVCAQNRGYDYTASVGPERLQLLVNAPARADENPLSATEIERCTQAMHAQLSRAGLSIQPVGAMRLTTPQDFAAAFPSTAGALYGRASHGWAASFLRQGSRTRIPGLYCAGGSTHPGAGLPMAARSGQLAVATLWADFRRRDRASTSRSRRAAMPGGMSTPAAPMAPTA